MIIFPELVGHFQVPTVNSRIHIEHDLEMCNAEPSDYSMHISVRPYKDIDKYKKRGEDISALINQTWLDTVTIINLPQESTSELKIRVKSLLENYKSLLDYAVSLYS
jgi:hypothetical protein